MDREHSGRHFTVAVFVVWEEKVLLHLHLHRKLGMWLPPGGHIEKDELPDDAAIREVFEETGLWVELAGEKREDVEDPIQLHRPAGVQLENIGPDHQHIDLIYFAKPIRIYRDPRGLQQGQAGLVRPRSLGRDAPQPRSPRIGRESPHRSLRTSTGALESYGRLRV